MARLRNGRFGDGILSGARGYFTRKHVQTSSGVQIAFNSTGTGVYINFILFIFRVTVSHTQVFLLLTA